MDILKDIKDSDGNLANSNANMEGMKLVALSDDYPAYDEYPPAALLQLLLRKNNKNI